MNDMIQSQIEQWIDVCRHEFGHCLVAMQLGFEVNEVKISESLMSRQHGGAEVLLSRHLHTIEQVVEFCGDRTKILLAGSIAESVEGGEVNDKLAFSKLESCGAHDYIKLKEVVRIAYCAMGEPAPSDQAKEAMNQLLNAYWTDTKKLVLAEYAVIDELALELATGFVNGGSGVLSKSDIYSHSLLNGRF